MHDKLVKNKDLKNSYSKRLTAFDFARLVAMLMMVQGHCIWELAGPEVINYSEFPWNVWNFCRGITAPVFLFVSGLVHTFANKRDEFGNFPVRTFKRRIKIALSLVFIGYLMVFPADRIYDLFYIDQKYLERFWDVNILHVFGVSLLYLAFLYKYIRNDKRIAYVSLYTALVITITSPVITALNWGEHIHPLLSSYFTYSGGSLFTLFPYSAFLFYGVFAGHLIHKIKNEERYKYIIKYYFPAGLILIVLGTAVYYSSLSEVFFAGSAWKALPGVILQRLGFVLFGLPIVVLIYKKTQFLEKYYIIFGRRAILIYLIHLIIIYGTPFFPGFEDFYEHSLTFPWLYLATALIIFMTFGITYLVHYLINNVRGTKMFFRYSITAYLIYLLFI